MPVEPDELDEPIEPLLPELLPEPPLLPPEELGELEAEPPIVVEPPDEPELPAVLGEVLELPEPAALPEPGCAPPPAVLPPSLPQAASDNVAAAMRARAVPRESWEAFIWYSLVGVRGDEEMAAPCCLPTTLGLPSHVAVVPDC